MSNRFKLAMAFVAGVLGLASFPAGAAGPSAEAGDAATNAAAASVEAPANPAASAPTQTDTGAVPQNDILNAVLWMQNSVEYKANTLAMYALGRLRLDEALADRSWTATDQTGAYHDLPPAVILDADETTIDNSAYEAGLVVTGADYSSRTWDQWVADAQARSIPGAVDFARYADSKGVKVFFVTNRTADQESATRKNMEALGFPMGGNVDTFLMSKEREGWGTAKQTRRDFVAKSYRVLLLFGDNFNDFDDAASKGAGERRTAFAADAAHWGHDWFMLPNPTYGSFESTAYNNVFKLPADEKRRLKLQALEPWTPPK